ncbi:MAG: hypothetical protein BECKG1743D_GA0114223_102085 [Candidatus Kentron sp. G]|nr:MAG: hypothetical protein BECKG1743D_GA0114223_102085 [Candidatus Kentron sp. G]
MVVPARRDGGKNKDCSELHDAIFAPVVTQGRNSGATAVDCEFPNSFSGSVASYMTRFWCFHNAESCDLGIGAVGRGFFHGLWVR